MRASRIKNIIILLLAVVNLFLLSLVGLRAWRTEQGERETRARMIRVLENNGIAFLPQEVPGELSLTGRKLTAALPEQERAAALVGEITGVDTAGARTTYTGTEGQAAFSTTGEVEIWFGSMARTAEAAEVSEAPAGSPDPTEAGRELLEALGLEVRLEEYVPGGDSGGMRTATYVQLYGGVPMPQYTLRVVWEGREPVAVTGRALFGTEESLTTRETITAPTALTRFLKYLNDGGYVCSQITRMYGGYASGGTGAVDLTPAWFIETDAWPWRFAVDGCTGAVTAAE